MDLLGNSNNYRVFADVIILIKMDQAYKFCYVFSYSASSEFSGITHNATAFVGCDANKVRSLVTSLEYLVSIISLVTYYSSYQFLNNIFSSVVHVLVLKVEEIIIVTENVRQLMVVRSYKVKFTSGIGYEQACLTQCGKDVWSLR